MRKLRPILIALPFVALLAGCPIYGEQDSGGRPACVGPGCECGIDYGCRDGFACERGRCVVDATCVDDEDCPLGEICEGSCEPGSRPCRTHGDCRVGEYCGDDGQCTVSGACSDDAACADTSFICDFRDTCVPDVEGSCRGAEDCSGDRVCVEGRCRGPGDVCQFNYQCGGLTCVNSRCTQVCRGDDACASGEHCDGGFCVPAAECLHTDDCTDGGHCVGGRCLPDCADGGSCESTADYCAEDEFCRPDWRPRPFCDDATNEGCAMGSICRDGACRTPCPGGLNNECLEVDHQLTTCATDNLCYTTNETMPECGGQADCDLDQSCVDAICR